LEVADRLAAHAKGATDPTENSDFARDHRCGLGHPNPSGQQSVRRTQRRQSRCSPDDLARVPRRSVVLRVVTVAGALGGDARLVRRPQVRAANASASALAPA
jgi:hypothetical protein